MMKMGPALVFMWTYEEGQGMPQALEILRGAPLTNTRTCAAIPGLINEEIGKAVNCHDLFDLSINDDEEGRVIPYPVLGYEGHRLLKDQVGIKVMYPL